MKDNLSTAFLNRQHMISKDFEIYYFNDCNFRNVGEHTHSCYEFYFFLEGDATVFFAGSTHRLQNGDMVVIPPGAEHSVRIHDPDVPYRRIVLWITESFLLQLKVHSDEFLYLAEKAGRSGLIWHFGELTFTTLQRKAFHVIEEIRSDRFGRRTAVALGINDLLLFINRMVFEGLHPERDGKDGSNLYRSLLRYIDEHITEDLRLNTLSGLFYVSKYHISHIFREQMGMSLHQYIIKKRLAVSKEALSNGRRPSEIFEESGFSDYSVFYRAFVKEYGVSPQKMMEKNAQTATAPGGTG